MIKKVLIAEDHETANISLQKTLDDLGINGYHYVHYCDDALTKIIKARQDNDTYDLLITDLYFEPDQNTQKLPDGTALIKAAREIQPDLRVLVFSAENQAHLIKALFDDHEIDGYVRKARNDAKELKAAIEKIAANQRHFPRHDPHLITPPDYEFTPFDKIILSLLTQGVQQKDIPEHLKRQQIKPSGLSSVEKKLKEMREALNFTSNAQLIAHCKDMKLI